MAKGLKQFELRLLSELMQNSKRSDRELARKLGVSQATVTRVRHKLENGGYIKEYTIIPDFAKLGYSIMALTLVKLKELRGEELDKARKTAQEDMKRAPQEIVLFERGIGQKIDGVIVSFHEDYTSYVGLVERARGYPFIDSTENLLVDLHDKVHYRSLTFSTLANHLLEARENISE